MALSTSSETGFSSSIGTPALTADDVCDWESYKEKLPKASAVVINATGRKALRAPMAGIKVLTRFDSVVKAMGGPTQMSHILDNIGGKNGPQYGQAVRFWKKTSGKFPPKHY